MLEDCLRGGDEVKGSSAKKDQQRLSKLESFSGMENFGEIDSREEARVASKPKKKKAQGFNLS